MVLAFVVCLRSINDHNFTDLYSSICYVFHTRNMGLSIQVTVHEYESVIKYALNQRL